MAAGVTITALEIEPVHAEYPEGAENVEPNDTSAAGVVIARLFLGACTHLLIMLTNLVRVKALGAPVLPETDMEAVSSSVTLSKKLISKEQVWH
jgi:hypothetical protein